MEYTLDGIDSRLEIAEEKINELDTIVVETAHTEAEEKNFFFLNEQSSGELWNKFKLSNVHIELGPQRRAGGGKIFETIIAENFPNLMRTIIPQIKGVPQN